MEAVQPLSQFLKVNLVPCPCADFPELLEHVRVRGRRASDACRSQITAKLCPCPRPGERPGQILQDGAKGVFGNSPAEIPASDPLQLVVPARQHATTNIPERQLLQAEIDICCRARWSAVDRTALHRSLSRARENAQLAGLCQPIPGILQPINPRWLDDIRKHDVVSGKSSAKPEGVLAILGEAIAANTSPSASQRRISCEIGRAHV